jgi:hypothetical protein
MRHQVLRFLVLSCALTPFAAAQAPNPSPSGAPLPRLHKPGSPELPATAASIGPNDPVITIDGACKSGSNGCVTSVNREQFEKLANAMKPQGMNADTRRNFAVQYAKILAFSDQARALGLENDPRYQLILQYVKNQLLVEALSEHYSEEYSHPSDQEIDNYYKQNSKRYLLANLQRVIIPSQPGAAEIKKPTEEEQKAYTEKVRQEWIKGADPATLQKQALERVGLTGSVPDVNLKDQAPGMIPSTQQSVFDLKPGEVSEAFVDPGGAYIYKMVSELQRPLSDVQAEISKTLHDTKMRDKLQELTESVKPNLNEAYFGPEKKPNAPAEGAVIPPKAGGPAAGSNAQPPASPSAQSNTPPPAPPK